MKELSAKFIAYRDLRNAQTRDYHHDQAELDRVEDQVNTRNRRDRLTAWCERTGDEVEE